MKRSLILLISATLILTACHSKKEVMASSLEVKDIEAKSSSITATDERMQWMSNIALSLDSFELIIPADHFVDGNKMVHDSVSVMRQMTTGAFNHATATARAVDGANGTFAAGQPPQGAVVLRARHASIGKNDRVERISASCAQQADSMVAHRTMDSQQHSSSDNVQVAKPPDLSWLTWAIIAALVVVFMIVIWLEYENIDKGK